MNEDGNPQQMEICYVICL